MIVEILAWGIGLLIFIVLFIGFSTFDEFELGMELATSRFNNFELGISNRNYKTLEGEDEQEIRVGLLIVTVYVCFTRFDV